MYLFSCSDEIAGCIEKAYEQIQFSEATRVLFFNSPKKMTDYAKKVKQTFYVTEKPSFDPHLKLHINKDR